MTHPLLQLFYDQASLYRLKEIWDGTHDFTKRVLEWVFGLAPQSSLVPQSSLFSEALYDNFYVFEWSKKQWAGARRDFRCKINGQLVVVETERLDNIQAGMKQIGGYMHAEHTNFGIVTDGGTWRFFKNGPDHLAQYDTLTIGQLCSDDGKAFLQNFYNSYDFYVHRLTHVQAKPFDTQIFHQWLITTAERIVFDLRHIGLFSGNNKLVAKEEIQTAYSLIIQILLIKIVQDKRKINILKKDEIVEKLISQDRNGVFDAVEWQLKWLWDFYRPYHNQQDSLLDKIISHYQSWSRIAKLNLDSIRLFLDLYHFIYSFDLSAVKQDLFGAVYENYLKELYKDDDTKKWQVFTPPEIVEFMLDEVWYTAEYIQWVISTHLSWLIEHIDDHTHNIPWLSLIDPACGSGTFLYKAAGRIVNALYNLHKSNAISDDQAGKIAELLICNNIVGFDIEPFPLYLAEMNILQSLLFFNVSAQGKILNTIDNQIKIFSTTDSIAEFHDLESSMEKDLQDLISWWDLTTLATKRDPISILQLKADLQDFDRDALMTKFQLDLYHKALQNEFIMVDTGQLIITEKKTYRQKHSKKILTLTTTHDLLAYAHDTLDDFGLLNFEKSIKSLKPQLDHIQSKLNEIITKHSTKRTKFDFVVANPPYISLNDIPKHIKENWKNEWLSMSNVFGINLHSAPDNHKKYPPKPNLYSYFNALGYFLLQENWKLCFIVPEWFVNYDCNTWFLSNKVNLERIYFFNTKVFINRGILWNMPVPTSAMTFMYSKSYNSDYISILWNNTSLENTDINIKLNQFESKKITRNLLKKSVRSWFTILKKDQTQLSFLYSYEYNSENLENYYDIIKSDKIYWDEFIFDIGFIIDEKNIQDEWEYNIIKWSLLNNYRIDPIWLKKHWKENISLTKNSQWYKLLDKKYYLTISIKNWKFFTFSDYPILFNMGVWSCIWSNNQYEMLYLFGILNSSITKDVFNLFKLEWEKDALFSLTFLKQKIRVPILNTPAKLQLKTDLITNSQAIIDLCKHWAPSTRWDICETIYDTDSLWPKIIWLRSQYQSITIDISTISISDPLPDHISRLIAHDTHTLSDLESHRDDIVRRLYELA